MDWEFAALAAANRASPWGGQPWDRSRADLCDEACSRRFSCPFTSTPTRAPDGFASTAPVGTFPSGDTPEGVHDLLGSVWEWSVGDPCRAQTTTCEGHEHVMRGSAWTGSVAAVFRGVTAADFASADMGFRCVRSLAVSEH